MNDQTKITLDDKYDQAEGRVFINGMQALVRLPLLQKARDNKAGLNTAGYISGYRGSPLGGLDAALWRENKRLKANDILFQPGVNEDLAMSAVWGTQLLKVLPKPKVDGVFAYWYGKGPGVDRSGDPMKHGNYYGTNRNGGVLLVYGDDHVGKSSSVAHQSEQALAANMVPSLYPANVEEILEFGQYGWALSRYCGLWCGLKIVNETAEQTATVPLHDFDIVLPERDEVPPGGVNVDAAVSIWPPVRLEEYVHRFRLPLLHRFVKANRIDKLVIDAPRRRLGIVATGKAYMDLLQALHELGLGLDQLASMGVSIYKPGLIWPIEPSAMLDFAREQECLLFIEEKKSFVEAQARELLYGSPHQPVIVGKKDQDGTPNFSSTMPIDTFQVVNAVVGQFKRLGLASEAVLSAYDAFARASNQTGEGKPAAMRAPYFCSGCPHNTSTRLPDGSLAMAGIGCHAMASLVQPDKTLSPAHMGGEGAQWSGLYHFTETPHMFQNLGDGTYYHSGIMCIRGSVASGANITYKILYNDAVAMTGGQPIDGPISVSAMIDQVLAEGVAKLVLVSDDIEKYTGAKDLPADVELRHRDEMDAVQRELRVTEGTTVILYEQTCAAEKRRRRKRGTYPDPAKRMFINAEVCEGCGDCSVQSTCVSLQPKETGKGVKRQIDQSSCNKDYSCVKGFCPSFVTVLGGGLRKPKAAAFDETLLDNLPEPQVPTLEAGSYGIMVTGIGGTGVITASAVLGMAAHIDGKAASMFDMTGLSQKNGAVFSHLKMAATEADLGSQKMSKGEARALLAFDLVAAMSDEPYTTLSSRTRVFGNSDVQETISFQFNRKARVDERGLEQHLNQVADGENSHFVDATRVGLALMGNTIAANMFLVGFAFQHGAIPLSSAAIVDAIRLNGVSVDFNIKAFNLGRLYAHRPEVVEAHAGDAGLTPATAMREPATFAEARSAGIERLTAYQGKDYASRYAAAVDRVAAAEAACVPGSEALSYTVALNLAQLMAYKDEWEVARLYADPAFLKGIEAQFEGPVRLRFNLAPPLLAKRDAATGHLKKKQFGAWVLPMFRVMARLKGLRGTVFDVFGKTDERRMERQLIEDYIALIDQLVISLTPNKLQEAVAIAGLHSDIRGFGHVKERNVQAVRAQEAKRLEAYLGQ